MTTQENPEGLLCSTCEGSGIESSYSGFVHHPVYGDIAVIDEHRYPEVPGGTFYGGSSHHQCRTCKGSGNA